MDEQTITAGLIAQLCERERQLDRSGIRLRIDRIVADGKSALCSVAQVRTSFFRPSRTAGHLIDLAHNALVPLQVIGIVPLISILPEDPKPEFAPVDKDDPFGFLSALPLRLRHEPHSIAH